MLRRLARALVLNYPQPWRDRYGSEVLELLDDSPVRLGDVGELFLGLVVERAQWFGTQGAQQILRRIIGSYCALHITAWLLSLMVGDPTVSSAWWTVDALMLSAMTQASAAAVTCGLGFGLLWMFSGQSHKTRSAVLDWLRLILATSAGIAAGMLSTAGVPPSREAAELVFGAAGQNALMFGQVVLIGEWIRLVGYRWLNPEPQSGALAP